MITLKNNASVRLPDVFLKRYKSADSAALKVALYLFECGSAEVTDIESALGISSASVERSLEFWRSAGLFEDNISVSSVGANNTIEPVNRHLNHSDIASLILSDSSISMLLQETQKLIGRELSFSESRLLVETIQDCGLDAEAILMIESYFQNTEHSRKVLTDTSRAAREMAKEGLVSYDSVSARVSLMESRFHNLLLVADLLKSEPSDFSKKERSLVNRIFEEYGYDSDFISEVLTRKPDANIPYISTVLKDWHKKGYTTISDTRLLAPAVEVYQTSVKNNDKDTESTLKKAVKRNRKEQ